jgi:drug/metabolite transporter (DMT)-like permease
MEEQALRPAGYALGSALLFGLSIPLLKLLAGDASTLFLVAFLYLGSALCMAVLMLRPRGSWGQGTRDGTLERPDILWLLLAILTGGIIAPVLLVGSLAVTPAATASLLLNFEAVATTVLAVVFFREVVRGRTVLALCSITLGGILLSWNPSAATGLTWGAAGVVLAGIFWGFDNNATRKIAGKDLRIIVLLKSAGAGGVSLALAFLLGNALPPVPVLLAGMLLGFVCYGLSMLLFIRALRYLGAARTSAWFSTAPYLGAVFSFILFMQVPGPEFIIPSFLLGAGTVLLATGSYTCPHHILARP